MCAFHFLDIEIRSLIEYSERQYFDPKNDFKWQITIKLICCKPYKGTFLSPKWPFRILKPFGISKVRCFHLKKYNVSFPKHVYMLKSVYSYGVDVKKQKSVEMWLCSVRKLTATNHWMLGNFTYYFRNVISKFLHFLLLVSVRLNLVEHVQKEFWQNVQKWASNAWKCGYHFSSFFVIYIYILYISYIYR